MRWSFVFQHVGVLIFFLGLNLVFPIGFSLFYNDGSLSALVKSMAITVAAGLALFLIFRQAKTEYISQREGMAIVAIGWTAVGLFAALPFYFDGMFVLFADAFFEAVSGFTTTGASVLTDIEAVSESMLFWRSYIQWLGGMGIIVLTIAILPFLGVGGFQLYKAEVPSPVPDKLRPRIKDTAMVLWKVYVLFTVVLLVLLMFGGLNFYEAACHALTTMPTGGFSTNNLSVAHYDSVYLDCIFILFMFIAGINFSLHYQMLRGRPLAYWKDSECRFFVVTVLVLVLIVSASLFNSVYFTIWECLRYGAFQVVSILTTTGYATDNYNHWPAMAQMILLLCMFFGASAGSTGGGMKMLRIMCCFKFSYKELFALLHPHAVTRVKIGGKTVSDSVIGSILGFLVLYMAIFAISSVLLTAMGVDFVTAFSAVASSLGNIGPGLGNVGPVDNYAHMPYMGKWLLAWCMLLGRLEIYTVIIFLVPEFWRK